MRPLCPVGCRMGCPGAASVPVTAVCPAGSFQPSLERCLPSAQGLGLKAQPGRCGSSLVAELRAEGTERGSQGRLAGLG